MFGLSTLILLTIFLYIWLKKILYKSSIAVKNEYKYAKSECDKLLEESVKLKADIFELGKKVEMTIALYDIAKDMCKTLDKDQVFINFCSEINKYIKLKECKLLKVDADLSPYRDYIVLPLEIDTQRIGYLAVDGVSQQDKDKFYILTQQFMLGMKKAHLYQRVQELAITDSLTGVFSRRYCLERFSEELERSKKFNYNFSFLMLDIDHFKKYNDEYGHLSGDAILREVAKTTKENIRQIDLVGRYGGEEFSFILVETDKEQAGVVAERIRRAVENKYIRVYDEELKVTVSIGISVFPEDAQDDKALIDKADAALYQAKQSGRNRVCVCE